MSGCCDGCSEIYKQRSYIQHHSKFSSLTMLSFELVKSGYQLNTIPIVVWKKPKNYKFGPDITFGPDK